jgi:cholest-4-en-3-one 26-monooxygenase
LQPGAGFGSEFVVGGHGPSLNTVALVRKVRAMLHSPATFVHGFPHDEFRELRDNHPVSYHEHPTWSRGYWAVVRHADVQRVSRDSATFHNAPHPFLEEGMPEDGGEMSELLISQDPPLHTKLRKLISTGFTPRRVSELEQKIRDRVDGIFDALATSRTDECDLVTDIALWLPLHVIADLVGVPESDRKQVFEWTELTFGFDETVSPEQRAEAAMAMYMYADRLCEERRDEPRDDLMSVLISAEVNGETLTQMQIDLFFTLLQNAGSETTRNLITTGTLVLLEHPDELDRLRSDLSLLPTAIEELLRWVSPVMQFTRRAVVDTEIAGQAIAAGDPVVLVYPSANRDERAFADPDRLDLTRTPNDHVAFGAGGPHYCLGANLARIEARVMFEALLTRIVGLEVTTPVSDLPRVHSNLIDGFAHVPVRWKSIRS